MKKVSSSGFGMWWHWLWNVPEKHDYLRIYTQEH